MVDQLSPPPTPGSAQSAPKAARSAALWAAAVAVPVAALAGVLIFSHLRGETSGAAPTPTAATPAVASIGPVAMSAPKLSARAEKLCLALTSQLPTTVRQLTARPVTAGPTQNAAWGDPAITIACGTAAPKVAAESFLMTMDRVCWYTEQRADATVWTAIDREIPVQVTVPTPYDAPAQWANEFSATLAATLPAGKNVPSGCA